MTASRHGNSGIRTELELRAQVKQVETEMAAVGERIRKIDDVLNHNLTAGQERGSRAAIDEYLAWLDRVEALKLAFVNANIVTQRLRLFYQGAARSRGRVPDPAPRMKEVKNLLETVRHTEQSNLLPLRARRHSLQAEIQSLAGDRKSGGRAAYRDGRGKGGIRPIGWLPLAILLLALLAGRVLLDAFQPEIVHFIRSVAGLRDTTAVSAPQVGAPQVRAPQAR